MKIRLTVSVARMIATIVVAAAPLAAGCGTALASDNAYNDIGDVIQNGGQNHVLCERATYSAAYDRWFKDYLAGKSAAAEKEWPAVLKVVAGADDISHLVRLTNSRLVFSDDESSGNRSELIVCDETILHSTEKVVGPNSLLVASVELFLCGLYEGRHDLPTAIAYRKKCLAIHEKVWGGQSPRLLLEWRDLSKRLIEVKDYKEAQHYADKLIAVARREKIQNGVKRGLELKATIEQLQTAGKR